MTLSVAKTLQILQSDDLPPFSFLESFARKYSQKVNENEKTPIFSKSTTYNKFPLRHHDSHFKKKHHKKSRWCKSEDKKEITRKVVLKTTTIKKLKGIKASIIKVLNKINENNFDNQVSDLIDVLFNSDDSEAVYIIAQVILDKIWYDKSYYGTYLNLLHKLWDNKTWISNKYKIFKNKEDPPKFFYSSEKDDSLNGPFNTREEANISAQKKFNLRLIFLELCRQNFEKRIEFLEEAEKIGDDGTNTAYKLRRKLFGTVEIIAYFYSDKLVSDKVVHFIVCELIKHNRDEAIRNEEIEAVLSMFKIMFIEKRMPIIIRKTFANYLPTIYKLLEKEWSCRTKYMLEEIVEILQIGSPKKVPLKRAKLVNVEKQVKTLVRKGNIKQALDIIDKNSNKIIEILNESMNDIVEYHEYSESQMKMVFSLFDLNKVSIDDLGICMSNTCENLPDIKIDAPRAPSNVLFFLENLLKKSNNILNVTVNPTTSEKEFVEEQLFEWNKIYDKLPKELQNKLKISVM